MNLCMNKTKLKQQQISLIIKDPAATKLKRELFDVFTPEIFRQYLFNCDYGWSRFLFRYLDDGFHL